MNEITIMNPAKIAFKNAELAEATRQIAEIGSTIKDRNIELAKVFGRISSRKLYADDGFKNLADYAEKTFGIKQSMAYQLAKVGETFYNSDSETMQTAAQLLPPSILAELVAVPESKIRAAMESGRLTDRITQQKTRELAKELKSDNTENAPQILPRYDIADGWIMTNDGKTIAVEGENVTEPDIENALKAFQFDEHVCTVMSDNESTEDNGLFTVDCKMVKAKFIENKIKINVRAIISKDITVRYRLMPHANKIGKNAPKNEIIDISKLTPEQLDAIRKQIAEMSI